MPVSTVTGRGPGGRAEAGDAKTTASRTTADRPVLPAPIDASLLDGRSGEGRAAEVVRHHLVGEQQGLAQLGPAVLLAPEREQEVALTGGVGAREIGARDKTVVPG